MLYPLGAYLVVSPLEETKTDSGVLVPEDLDVDTSAFKLVEIVESNDESKLEKGMRVVIPTHMLETVAFFGETYYLVTENHVVGFVKNTMITTAENKYNE